MKSAPPAAERTAFAKALIAWWDNQIDNINWNTEKGLGWFTFWGIIKALDPKNPRIAKVEETFGMVIKPFDAASASEGMKPKRKLIERSYEASEPDGERPDIPEPVPSRPRV